jgi:hypothetical protein
MNVYVTARTTNRGVLGRSWVCRPPQRRERDLVYPPRGGSRWSYFVALQGLVLEPLT